MSLATDLNGLSKADLKAFVTELLGRVAELERTIAAQRDEIARLKGLKGRPQIKPSGMEQASEPAAPGGAKRRRGAGRNTTERVIHEDRIVRAVVPPGSRFKGYQDFILQDLILRPHVVRLRRERWHTPDGRSVTAPMPPEVRGHFGPALRRFVLVQYHQGQVTVPRLLAQLRAIGIPEASASLTTLTMKRFDLRGDRFRWMGPVKRPLFSPLGLARATVFDEVAAVAPAQLGDLLRPFRRRTDVTLEAFG